MWALVDIKPKIANIRQLLQLLQNSTHRLKSWSDINLSILLFRSKINAYKKNERLINKRFVSLSSKLRTWFGTLKKKVRGDRKRILYFSDEAAAENIYVGYEDSSQYDQLRPENQVITDQNQTLQDTITSMNEAMERRNGQMLALQNQITALANRPSPFPPCVIL